MKWSRLRFWWRYLRQRTPWDTGIAPPEIVALAERLPPGRALDLGCGTGTSTLFLAARGWDAVGIDFAPTAIRHARRRARATPLASGRATFHVADVTRLDFLEGPFDLLVDVGCLHALPETGQRAYATHLARLARPGATLAMYVFLPRETGRGRFGLTPEEVTERFSPAFNLISTVIGQDSSSGHGSVWYELRRA